MKKTNTLILFALITVFFSSCSMEKRLYNKGFHVTWNKKYKAEKNGKAEIEPIAMLETETTTEATAPEVRDILLESVEDAPPQHDLAELELNQIEEEQVAEESKMFEHSSQIAGIAETDVLHGYDQELSQSSKETKKQKTSDSESSSSGRSQVIALILVILFGILGVHRFYLGYTGIGVLMLLTLGLFGILALIDLIRIAVGDLKPKNGDYTETL